MNTKFLLIISFCFLFVACPISDTETYQAIYLVEKDSSTSSDVVSIYLKGKNVGDFPVGKLIFFIDIDTAIGIKEFEITEEIDIEVEAEAEFYFDIDLAEYELSLAEVEAIILAKIEVYTDDDFDTPKYKSEYTEEEGVLWTSY